MAFIDQVRAINIQLNGTNYTYWAYLMQNFLVGKELWSYVDGSLTVPNASTAHYAKLKSEWDTCNARIITWINNSVDPSIGMQLAKF